jgi:hypothetical protein
MTAPFLFRAISSILILTQNWGWACESLAAVEVITAQGKQLLCNAQQNEDLYWAARGAGPGKHLP